MVDPDGMSGEDWVLRGNGDIEWDDEVTSHETAKGDDQWLGYDFTVSETLDDGSTLITTYLNNNDWHHYGDSPLPEFSLTAKAIEKPSFRFGGYRFYRESNIEITHGHILLGGKS